MSGMAPEAHGMRNEFNLIREGAFDCLWLPCSFHKDEIVLIPLSGKSESIERVGEGNAGERTARCVSMDWGAPAEREAWRHVRALRAFSLWYDRPALKGNP